MTTSARPMKDRRGRVYTPAVGRRLRPLLWIILGGFALLGANGVYLASLTALTWWQGTTQQTFFSNLMFILHLVLGFAILVPFLVFGFAHLATSWKRPNKSAVRFGLALLVCALVVGLSGLVLVRLDRFERFEVRDPTVRAVGYWLHVVTPLLAIGLYVKHRLAGPAHPLGVAEGLGGHRGGLRGADGPPARAGPAVVRRPGAQAGQAVLLPVRGGHGHRQVHPGRDPDDGRLLPEVPPGRLQGLVPLRAPLQLVQQQAVPDQRPRDPARSPWSATATRRPPAGARAATTRSRSSRASSTTRTTTT